MNPRNACLAALVAATTLFAGCAAQYRNPNACEEEMRNQLADKSMGDLAVSHSATTWRGARVVIEGSLDPQESADAASGASGAVAASGVSASDAAVSARVAHAARGERDSADTTSVQSSQASYAQFSSALPGVVGVPTLPGGMASTDPKATTPVGVLAEKLGLKKPTRTPAAAECTFNESGGIASFRWLAPPRLAATTPDPNADE